MDITNKTAVITGGAQGLGKGFAEAILENGGNVVIADFNAQQGIETAKEFHEKFGPGRSMFMLCDVRKSESLQAVISNTMEYYGKIDIFVNNAGITAAELNTILVNLHGVIMGTQYALQAMSREEGGTGGVIVNVASLAGLKVVSFSPIYSASKYGVVGYSRCIAARKHETENENIRVVCLCPSFVETPMISGEVQDDYTRVIIADFNAQRGIDTAKEFQDKFGPGRSMFMLCDVRQSESIKDVISKAKEIYGNIHIFVNNAGINAEDLDTVLVNLHGVIMGTQQALQAMSREEGGSGGVIVNVASTAGLTVVPFSPIYSATKFGVVGYSRCVAARNHETEAENIRVVCLCPSFTETAMVDVGHVDESFESSVSGLGLMQISRVVTAFMKLVADKNNNGGVLAVTPKELEYKFPRKWRSSKL